MNAIKCLLTEMHILANRMLKEDSRYIIKIHEFCLYKSNVCKKEIGTTSTLVKILVFQHQLVTCLASTGRMFKLSPFRASVPMSMLPAFEIGELVGYGF